MYILGLQGVSVLPPGLAACLAVEPGNIHHHGERWHGDTAPPVRPTLGDKGHNSGVCYLPCRPVQG